MSVSGSIPDRQLALPKAERKLPGGRRSSSVAERRGMGGKRTLKIAAYELENCHDAEAHKQGEKHHWRSEPKDLPVPSPTQIKASIQHGCYPCKRGKTDKHYGYAIRAFSLSSEEAFMFHEASISLASTAASGAFPDPGSFHLVPLCDSQARIYRSTVSHALIRMIMSFIRCRDGARITVCSTNSALSLPRPVSGHQPNTTLCDPSRARRKMVASGLR